MTNTNLNNAKKAKNDEFYTRLTDIEKELSNYDPAVFKDKIIFCNCDDPTSSNFWVFFHMNFNRLGLKKLITTHCNIDGSPSYAMTYDSKDPKDDIDFDKGTKIPLKGDGDFRSAECIDLLKQSDMVVTNPPFSLFRAYIAQLEKYHKQFIVIGNLNAVTYKSIFPLIKDNKLWLGFSQPKDFDTPNGLLKKVQTRWFTNVDTKKRHHKLETVYRWRKRKEKYPDLYPKYDNYDAIEVSKVLQIPLDYDGAMGVPITFLDKFNPNQFEIIGYSSALATQINEIAKKGTYQVGGRAFYSEALTDSDLKHGFKYHRYYGRIVIKNKHPEDYQNRWRKRKEKYPDLYPKYDNYDAIEVGKVLQIPLDYDGAMGVPITFLDVYNPDQFEIIGADEAEGTGFSKGLFLNNSKHKQVFVNGKRKYKRIFIRNKHPEDYQNDL